MPDSPSMFETEFIIDVTADEPERLARMVFTADELRAITQLLNQVTPLYRNWNPQIREHFFKAWVETSSRSLHSLPEFKAYAP